MATLLVFLLLILPLAMGVEQDSMSSSFNFIRASCRATRYETLCIQSLSRYAGSVRRDDRSLAKTALTISLVKARSAQSFVAGLAHAQGIKGTEGQVIRDCLETVGDSVDRLRESISELSHIGPGVGSDFLWHLSNVQTWVSAALTDEDTCLDGLSSMNGNTKVVVGRRIRNVARVTSVGLALVNRFASNHAGPKP